MEEEIRWQMTVPAAEVDGTPELGDIYPFDNGGEVIGGEVVEIQEIKDDLGTLALYTITFKMVPYTEPVPDIKLEDILAGTIPESLEDEEPGDPIPPEIMKMLQS